MASGNFEKCLAVTEKWEGGYSNNPNDPGGPTERGIIQREYDAWRGKRGRRTQPVSRISDAEVYAIYHDEYWVPAGCEALPAGMDLCVFDAAVNSGVARAKEWIGNDGNIVHNIVFFCKDRIKFLMSLGRLWHVFGQGWTNRVSDIQKEALMMASECQQNTSATIASKSGSPSQSGTTPASKT